MKQSYYAVYERAGVFQVGRKRWWGGIEWLNEQGYDTMYFSTTNIHKAIEVKEEVNKRVEKLNNYKSSKWRKLSQ